MSTLFTQKHYEHILEELRDDRDLTDDQAKSVADFLCNVFCKDNPKFKPIKFLVNAKNRKTPRRAQ